MNPTVRLVSIAEQVQHHDEQVDEVEIELEGAHDRLLARHRHGIAFRIHVLDVLGVVGGQPDEHQNADHRDGELHGRALQEPPLSAWRGEAANIEKAKQAFRHRAKCNGAARHGKYTAAMEQEPVEAGA